MRAKTIGFAVADDDRELLDQLVKEFGGGNRSEFLRVAMRRMKHEMLSKKFVELQSDVRAELGGRVLSPEETLELIRQLRNVD